MNPAHESVVAVVVTFFPDAGLASRLAVIARECARVIVVDNGSDETARANIVGERVELIALGQNCGLAAALNMGLERSITLGFGWAVTFDQDSTPEPGMVDALWRTRLAVARPERVAVVGPRLRDERVGHADHRWVVPHPCCRWWYRRLPCKTRDLAGVAFVITSGALTSLKIFREVGPMDEGLFIDYIDHDYCLRARRAGYEVMVSADAMLTHNMGERREHRLLGRVMRPTFHSALRLRYIARNRCTVWRRHAWTFPHWAAYDAVHFTYRLVCMLAFEDNRPAKLAAVVRGTMDGLLGRRGKIS